MEMVGTWHANKKKNWLIFCQLVFSTSEELKDLEQKRNSFFTANSQIQSQASGSYAPISPASSSTASITTQNSSARSIPTSKLFRNCIYLLDIRSGFTVRTFLFFSALFMICTGLVQGFSLFELRVFIFLIIYK